MNWARCVVTYLSHPKTPVLAATLEERTSRSSLLQKNWKESQTLLHGRYYGKFPFEFFPCYFHIWWLGNDVSKTINFGVFRLLNDT